MPPLVPAPRPEAGGPRGGTARRPGLLPRLTGLRAFAALAVFVVHLDAHDVAALPWGVSEVGGTGVGFFFVLSGFVLAWGTEPRLPARTFYRRRLARVYPSDLATLAVAAAVPVVAADRSVEGAVANAFMVQAWFRDDDVVYAMNGVSWSLSCEAFFYAVFPLAVLAVRRCPRWTSWSLAGLGLGLAAAAALVAPSLADHLPPVRLSEFLLGLVAGVAFRDGWRPRVPGLLAGTVLVVALGVSAAVRAPVINAIMAVPFLLVVLSAAGRDLTGSGGWLASRALVLAGEASFAFYLVHELVIVNLTRVLPEDSAVQVPVIATAAVLAAVALHLLVERPGNRLLRDRAPSLALGVPAPESAREGSAPTAGLSPPS
ncbi:acyltransferase family protein [Blastococcus sp. SYSU D00695]